MVSWTDYESIEFKPFPRDFDINVREMEYELYEGIIPRTDSFSILRHGVSNKLYQIIRAVEKSKIGITALDMNGSEGSIQEVGITVEGAIKTINFASLKSHKYDLKEIQRILNKINKLLSARGGTYE